MLFALGTLRSALGFCEAKKPVERGAMSIGSYLRSTQQLKRAIFGFLSSS
jgi:hypothetical protein